MSIAFILALIEWAQKRLLKAAAQKHELAETLRENADALLARAREEHAESLKAERVAAKLERLTQ